MAETRIFGGPAVRRIRRASGLTQMAMAKALDISPSYLNLIEHGQRPLSASLIVRLAERFGFDPASLASDQGIGGAAGLRRRLADPELADLAISPDDVEDWLGSAPALAAAFARIYDARERSVGIGDGVAEAESVRLVRIEIERWSNHFADLDAQAEALFDDLRLADADLFGAISERLRSRHQIQIRILPVDTMPDLLRRLDLHARQLQLSELLGGRSRRFQAAVLLAQLEARSEIESLVAGAGFTDRVAMRLFRRHLAHYYAAATVMPYGRFLLACEGSGYDLGLLERRFGVGFEQLAHRLTTLQRVGARGLPFFMLRIDRAAQVSKRYAGASGSPMIDGAIRCANWRVHEAFERPGVLIRDLVELEDASRWLTLARTVESPGRDRRGRPARFAVVLGIEQRLAGLMTAPALRPDLGDEPTLAGLSCGRCMRVDCLQRAQPPHGAAPVINERERGLTGFAI